MERPPTTREAGSRRQGPLTGGATLAALRDLGCEIGRVNLTPTLGRPDHTLDSDRLQDLKDHIASLRNAGIRKYVLTLWSPPPYMKLARPRPLRRLPGPEPVFGPGLCPAGPLRPGGLLCRRPVGPPKRAGLAAPLSVSLQNEPAVNPTYDGCVYADNAGEIQTWRRAA